MLGAGRLHYFMSACFFALLTLDVRGCAAAVPVALQHAMSSLTQLAAAGPPSSQMEQFPAGSRPRSFQSEQKPASPHRRFANMAPMYAVCGGSSLECRGDRQHAAAQWAHVCQQIQKSARGRTNFVRLLGAGFAGLDESYSALHDPENCDVNFFVFPTFKKKEGVFGVKEMNSKRSIDATGNEKAEPNAKRRQAARWTHEKIEGGCLVDLSRPIFFVDATYKAYTDSHRLSWRGPIPSRSPHRMEQTPKFHTNGDPMSVCYRYVLWLDPSLRPGDRDSVHSQYRDIERWSNLNGQYFFRKDPFNFLGLPVDFQMAMQDYLTPAEIVKAEPAHEVFRAHGPQACETVTFNLEDPMLQSNINKWKAECDTARFKIKKVIVDGPLALQETPMDDTENTRDQRNRLIEFLTLAEAITFKSVEEEDLGRAYVCMKDNLKPKQVHVEELRVGVSTYNTAADTQFLKVEKMFKTGVLTADRWVYGIRGERLPILQNTLLVQQSLFQVDRPIYIAVDQTNDETLFEIENLGIRNYVVPDRFRDPPNEAVRAFVDSAERVIYRPFYEDRLRTYQESIQ